MTKQSKNITTIVTLSSILLFAASSNASTDDTHIEAPAEYEAVNDSMETHLCLAAAKSTQAELKQTMFQHVHEYRTVNGMYKFVANNVLCNGKAIADFAVQAGNMDVAYKLASYEKQRITISDLAKAMRAAKRDSSV
jgi:hypothetical protein